MPATLLVPLVLLFTLVEPLPQDPTYHAFADARSWLGIPRFADVASNLPFLIVGLLGMRASRRLGPESARAAWTVLFGGVTLVAAGSSFYHLEPDSSRLVWDRLPMTVGFMGLFVALLAEHMHLRLECSGLLVAVPIGVLGVVYWRVAGDLRPYVWVQLAPMLAIPVLLLVWPSPLGGARWLLGSLGLYGLAKVAEIGDAGLFEATGGLFAGHAVKHVLAAAGAWLLVVMLERRAGSVASSGASSGSQPVPRVDAGTTG